MLIKIPSITYVDGTIRCSEAVYFNGSELYSMTMYLKDDFLEIRTLYPKVNNHPESLVRYPIERDGTIKKPCKTVEIDGIIYGQTEYDNGYLVDVENFIIENMHLRYVRKHSDEILALLESKAKNNEQE